MTRNHPSDATLVAHAAGRLPKPHRVVLRAHLATCPACRAGLALANSVGATLMADMPAAPLAEDALAGTLARLGPQEPRRVAVPVPHRIEDFATGRWWWLGPGIRLMPLRRRDADDARLDLIRVAPGTAMPAHAHTGTELTCILAGAYRDETGTYRAGDVAEGDEDLDHEPVAIEAGEDCVCLIATTGRLRARSWLARLVSPLVGV